MASTHDEGFREIQLSGKQLVFVAMAGVVIAVVIFLMGVQVGRGVLAQRGLPDVNAASSGAETEPPPPPASAGPGPGAPVAAGEQLSYAERLSASEPTPEKLIAPRPEPARAKPDAPEPAASPDPAGSGFSIQVAALREREEADTIVKRLVAKGYPAYVASPIKEKVPIFRVRIGKYKDRHEADTVAAKLQKEEQFKPWVVR
jgi:cell division septation protein DedD